LLFLFFFSGQIQAQVLNIDKFFLNKKSKDTSNIKWIGNVGLNFSLKQQKRDLVSFSNFSNIVYLVPRHYYALITSFHLTVVNGSDALNDGLVQQRSDFWRKSLVSMESLLNFQYDLNRGLQQRWQAGLSAKINLVETKRTSFRVGVGALCEVNYWKKANTDEFETSLVKGSDTIIGIGKNTVIYTDDIEAVRSTLTLYFAWEPSKSVQLNSYLTSQNTLDTDFIENRRIISDNILQVKISKVFAFNTKLALTYDNIPSDVAIKGKVNSLIYSFTQGITWKF